MVYENGIMTNEFCVQSAGQEPILIRGRTAFTNPLECYNTEINRY